MTESKPSKSERKREQLRRQALGEELITLSEAELAILALDDKLVDAVRSARGIRSHGALRRQKQLIGKLMRDVDPEPIRRQLLELRTDDLRQKRTFADAEKWRDRITREGPAALAEFEAETGRVDQRLSKLLAEFDDAVSDRDVTTLRRSIFRRVHDMLT